ncbi:MAG: glycosyltransferase family 2 protein [Parasphingorhabdus sp.]|nr:glycosyltransferase family 2 protein [Parasphingorhabdus sp.]
MVLASNIAVILVNFRGASDTIACLDSLVAGKIVPHIILIDNASSDDSLARFTCWAQANSHNLARFRATAADHPITDKSSPAWELRAEDDVNRRPLSPFTIIQSNTNWGFAGGCNLGLNLALASPQIELFWLLNNDTVVTEATAPAFVDAFSANPEWGMAGGPLRLFYQPDKLQLANGMRFHPLTAQATGILAGQPADSVIDTNWVMDQTDFVSGASMCVSRRFLDVVGLMEPRFFLYYEEIDWAMRARGRFKIGYIPNAVVYHKEGATAGSPSGSGARTRSPLSEYHFTRSKLIFGAKHFPWLVPLYFCQNIAIFLRRILRRQPAQARAVLRASLGMKL